MSKPLTDASGELGPLLGPHHQRPGERPTPGLGPDPDHHMDVRGAGLARLELERRHDAIPTLGRTIR
jgi:hypothetical protein